MNCKWAEGHLSACLDGTVDPAVRDEVEAHVKDCTHCGGILSDFRHFDGLVRDLPRYQPSEELRQRIFGSPEFAAIVHELDGVTPLTRGAVISGPSPRSAAVANAVANADYARTGHDRPLEALPIPGTTPTSAREAAPMSLRPQREHNEHARSGAHPWARVALSAAAAVTVMVGSALLIKQGLSRTAATGGHANGISEIGNVPGQQPLSVGNRVIFARGGALWSAPEHGVGLAKQLTPAGVNVAPGWTIVPAGATSGGDSIAYIDLKTGRLHIVRSDDQRDHTVGQPLAPGATLGATFWSGAQGQAILSGLSWAPNGSALAYLADDGSGHTSLYVATMSGTNVTRVTTPTRVSASLVRWSPDSLRIAFVQTDGAGQSVWDFNVSVNQVRELSAAAEPGGDASATVRQLEWLGISAGPTVTWTSGNAASGTTSGVFSMSLSASAPRALTPAGTVFTAADFTPARAGGTWLLGDGSTLYAVSGLFPGRGQLTQVAGGVSAASWSPDGESAAYLGGDGSLYVWIRAQFTRVASGVSASSGFSWSPDGSSLAFVANSQLNLVAVSPSNNQVGTPTVVSGVSATSAFAWAPDGQAVAVSFGSKVALISPTGAVLSVVDAQASPGAVLWSVVR